LVHGVDDGQRQTGQRQHKDEEHGHAGGAAGHRTDLQLRDAPDALAPMPHRGEEHDHVMHGAGHDCADDDPQRTRKIPELRGQHRPHQGPGRGNGGEMVPEEHVAVGLHVIDAVSHDHGRRPPRRIYPQGPAGKEKSVIAIGDSKDAQRNEYQSKRVHSAPQEKTLSASPAEPPLPTRSKHRQEGNHYAEPLVCATRKQSL